MFRRKIYRAIFLKKIPSQQHTKRTVVKFKPYLFLKCKSVKDLNIREADLPCF